MSGKSLLKSIGMIILIPIMIIVLLAGMIFAIFNGVIEIIKAVLDNVLDFLENPTHFILDMLRHAHNTWVTAFRRGRSLL